MPIIEKLGSFYLGKTYDLATRKLGDAAINYDARDLTTHAVCVGMTGSGKTGLCIDLLEEAALDGVPAIIIDPKGDITNLLLTFPELQPEDFLPWVNLDDARRKGQTPEEFAAAQAKLWSEGLASWEQGPERIRALKEAADFTIYTPGSDAGLTVSILSSFQAPQLNWDDETETLRERIQGTVSALLGLVGVDADPVRSREHILLSTIVETAWRGGQDLDLAKLIQAVQKPPFRQVGVLDVDAFYPEKDRFGLAMALNNIVASPSFGAWLQGEALDVAAMLHTPSGKPRHTIFYIAHLSDAERMFFVTILLENIISWMRAQQGTTSLRALLYMDEVFGYFPPTANPPSKRPMLTLLKQARAFGLGVMLTTQNPVDLDYKGLTNTGTWFIGKLQAERDKQRLLDGLEGALSESGASLNRSELDRLITSLDSRVFLLHNVHGDGPVVFMTRWAMSYLRGPLTRQQVRSLMAERKAAKPEAMRPAAGPVRVIGAEPEVQRLDAKPVSRTASPAPVPATPAGLSQQPPMLPPGIEPRYLPVAVSEREAERTVMDLVGTQVTVAEQQLVYRPALVGFATVRFTDRKIGLDEERDLAFLLPEPSDLKLVSWRDAEPLDASPQDLDNAPADGAFFAADLPEGASSTRTYTSLQSGFADYLYRSEVFKLPHNRTLKLYAQAGESEREFSVRCQEAAREARDKAVDTLRDKYEVKLQRLEERLTREERELEEDKAEYKGRMGEEVLSGLSSVIGALGVFGRKSRSLSGLSRAATKRRMTSSAKADIAESEAEIERLKADFEALKAEMEQEAEALTEQWSDAAGDIEEIDVKPRKTDVKVQTVALAWAPSWEVSYEDARGRQRSETLAGYQKAA
jgi:hypothetical protein